MPFVTRDLCTGYNEITVHNYIFCGKETNAQTCCQTTALTLTSTATKIVNVCNDVNATATTAAAATQAATTTAATATLSATAFGHEKCSADNWKSFSAWKSLAPFSGFT